MPFIPHTQQDIHEMLARIGEDSIENLFDEIPTSLRYVPSKDSAFKPLTEMELSRLMHERVANDERKLCFIGAGAYEHHIPAAVWEIASRGEFMTAYTPYQAEASQGTLQLLFEYQTMMASLMGLAVSNASLYDGASALAEAVLMAVRLSRSAKVHRILMPQTVHPHYRQVVQTIVAQQAIEIMEIPFDETTGQTSFSALEQITADNLTALVIPQPNFFGVLENVNALTEWAETRQLKTIGVVNPLAMALLNPPGQWGNRGADIACGEGQPLGVPLSSGGPYYGFLCCKQEYVRQLPGRIVGRTTDQEGNLGFVLTLQAREQHIRRAKATSNICTNQGLLVTASTIYMSLLGPEGLRQVAIACCQQLNKLREKLSHLRQVRILFKPPFFHEMILQFDQPVEKILHGLAGDHIQAGLSLKKYYPELGESLLICVTETKTEKDLDVFVSRLQAVIKEQHEHLNI